MSQVREVLGYPLLAATMGEVVGLCEKTVSNKGLMQIGVVNAAKIVNAAGNPALHDAVLSCDVILADGQSVVWASRLLGRPLPERVTGIDLFVRLLELADRRRLSVYLLGGSREVNDEVVRVISERYPHALIAGHRDGYFTDGERVARDIAASHPDLLFLGMSSPQKEIFLKTFQAEMAVPITHGVGGSFDILAGVTKRAPERWQRWGMEWAYRLVQEPGRMWRRYLRTNLLFCVIVGRAWASQNLRMPFRRSSLEGVAP